MASGLADTQAFEEFVTTRSPSFLRLAYALTRDHANAEDLLQTALARTWPAWKRISGDPEPYVRRVLVNTHNSWWRRRWNGERATEVLPESPTGHPQSTVDDRDEVWRALERLPKRQRAVLVLRFFEDLSEAQIAETLGMAPGTVKSYAAKGLAQLRQDPTLLASLPGTPAAPEGNERLTGVNERIRQRRRTRAITVVAAIVILVALLFGTSPVIDRLSLKPEPAGPAGFPLHLSGDRVVAGQRASFAQIHTGSGFFWSPSTLDTNLYIRCDHESPSTWVKIDIEINRVRFDGTTCDEKQAFTSTVRVKLDEQKLRQAGVQEGRPVEVILTYFATRGLLPDKGMVAVGIGETVPWDQYPFPKRPNRLPALDRKAAQRLGGTLLQANGAQTAQLDGRARYAFSAQSQTPGLLRIRMGGREVTTLGWWDYKGGRQEWVMPTPAPFGGNDAATLTVTPEHMTGDWILVVQRVD